MGEPITLGALAPTLAKVATGLAAKVVGSAVAERKKKQKEAAASIESAWEIWWEALLKQLDAFGYSEDDLAHRFSTYQASFCSFLEQEDVQAEVMRPFTGDTLEPVLDHEIIRRSWNEAGLPFGEELNMAGICRSYVKALNAKRALVDEMWVLLGLQVTIASNDKLEDIRGHVADFDLDLYARQFREKYNCLDLSAMARPGEDHFARVTVGAVFVPQDAREAVPVREVPREYLREAEAGDEAEGRKSRRVEEDAARRWTESKRRPVREILSDPSSTRKIVILGDPGSGKTMLVRDLCLKTFDTWDRRETDVESWLQPFIGRLPLLLELRNFVAARRDGHCQSFVEYWHYLGKTEEFGLSSASLTKYLKVNPSLVVFDGLDEVIERGERDKVIGEIIGFAGAHDQARVIVTSRIQGYRPQRFNNAAFTHATLEELSDKQIETFTSGWFAAVFPDLPAEAETRHRRVEDALNNSPPLRTLAGNPLLLTMIAIVARNQELPRERARLYEHALGVLVFNWDMTGKYINASDLPRDLNTRDNKLELLRWVAMHMGGDDQRLASNVISREHLEEAIRGYLESPYPGLKPRESRAVAAAIVHQLHERNFVLCLQGANLYGFVHRTFLEFLIAEEYQLRLEKRSQLSMDDLIVLFREKAFEERWREILRLVCGLVDESRAGILIKTILSINNERVVERVALAAECLAETKRVSVIPDIAADVLSDILTVWSLKNRENWPRVSTSTV